MTQFHTHIDLDTYFLYQINCLIEIRKWHIFNFFNYQYFSFKIISDYINNLVPDTIDSSDELINNRFYYFAIDIKNWAKNKIE